MKNILEKLKNKIDLTREESFEMQERVIKGEVSKDGIVEIFELFENKEITGQEIVGIVNATRDNMTRVDIDFDCLDNCGTGGDCLNTFNISTVSAIVCAVVDIPMAKHGNRAASSKCGSADILEELGVKIELNANQAKKCLEEVGIVFMFAPLFHPALKHVKDARVEYGKRTYFNFLGPMLNPASAKYQLIGVSDMSKAGLVGNTLIQTGSKKVIIVGGNEGLDEISVAGDTNVMLFDSSQGEVKNYKINPSDFNLEKYFIKDLQGGIIEQNAKIFMNILKNEATSAQINAVLLNSAASMFVFGKVSSIEDGIELAREVIQSGKALEKLNKFIEVSNSI